MSISRFTIFLFLVASAVAMSCGSVPNNDPARRHDEDVKVAARSSERIAVAFYNCENLFDYHHEPGKQDDDFTPEGKYHYTQAVYEQKLHNIATVLQSMSSKENGDLAIAGLAEIENDEVLADLCAQPELGNSHLRHICHKGPDPRGINTGFIYDPSLFTLIEEGTVPVIFESGGHSRDILHVEGVLDGDTVDVFINHWTSRRNANSGSDEKRMMAAKTVKSAIGSTLSKRPRTKVIIMGDFNDNPTDVSITEGLGAKESKDGLMGDLYNPFIAIYKGGRGTEQFKGDWNLFDQIMLSDTWFSDKGKLHEESADIYAPDFIRETGRGRSDGPKRSFKGGKWMNGYSDHFPVIMTFRKM
jgi:predicted extracellular nuclease